MPANPTPSLAGTAETMTADDVALFEVTRNDDEVARRVLATYAALAEKTAENAYLRGLKDDAVTERDALRASLATAQESEAEVCLALAGSWLYGDWKAETAGERDQEAIMRRRGYWPITEMELVNRRAAIDAARPHATREGAP